MNIFEEYSSTMFPLNKSHHWKPPTEPQNFSYLVFSVLLGFSIFVFERYLSARQRRLLHDPNPPRPLIDSLSKIDKTSSDSEKSILKDAEEKFSKTQDYSLAKSTFEFISSTISQMISIGATLCGLYPLLWDLSADIIGDPKMTIKMSIVFTAMTVLFEEFISLPFSIYNTFYLEHRYNFNKTTPLQFVKDKLKSLLLMAAIGTPVLITVIWVVEKGGKYFFIYLWAFLFVFALLMMTIYPVFIAPLFNKYEPLQKGELRTAIEDLAAKVSFPLKELYVVDGSIRSAHSNAYMYGFGKNKRIVLYDTLLTQVKQPELVAILGHELGHWKMGHTLRNFFVAQVYTFLTLMGYGFVTGAVGEKLLGDFGFDSTPPLPALLGIMLYMTAILAPLDHILSFCMNALSRRYEFQADAYAVGLGLGGELQTGLCKISLANLGNMNPDKLYSAYHYSHPPLVERLSAMMEKMERDSKKEE
mmetsp:Transcript_2651/g.3624  ORF Transcript_2651/g.3624 Transcript_2651/m.3624 type:complete len:473 (+) Transcript_2651:50-1468(+)